MIYLAVFILSSLFVIFFTLGIIGLVIEFIKMCFTGKTDLLN